MEPINVYINEDPNSIELDVTEDAKEEEDG